MVSPSSSWTSGPNWRAGVALLVPVAMLAACGNSAEHCEAVPCGGYFFAIDWCLESQQCTLDGAGALQSRNLVQGVTLGIPLGDLGALLGARNDLHIWRTEVGWQTPPDFRDATLTFDGEPASGCDRSQDRIWCRDLVPLPGKAEFRYDDGIYAQEAPARLRLFVELSDQQCLAEWLRSDCVE